MSQENWIKINSKLIDSKLWRFTTIEQKAVLIALLLTADHESNPWGQNKTSLENIATQAGKGITPANVRTALNKFEKWGILTNESTKQGRQIVLANSEYYQCESESITSEITNDQQTWLYGDVKDKINVVQDLKDFLDVFYILDYFMSLYRVKLKKEHIKLSLEAWEQNINKIATVKLPQRNDEIDDLTEEELKKMFNAYFEQEYHRSCDYSLPHFNSDAVKENLLCQIWPEYLEHDPEEELTLA